MASPKVSVIIPAYNEARTIGEVVKRIRELYPDFEVNVINDGSTDHTVSAAEEAGARVYSHPYNIGNGAAIKSGIRTATGDILIFIDGDGQHDPADMSKMLAYFPEYDMVVGARLSGGQSSFIRAFGNKIYNWLASYVAKFPVKDLTSGYRAIKSDVARSFLYLLPNTYSYPSTLTLSVLRTGRTLAYLPINVGKRKKGSSHIRLLQDGVRFFMIITRISTFYSPMRVFLPVSFLMFLLGLIRYIYSYISMGRFTNMSALLFVSSVIVFMMSLISEQICQLRFERRGRKTPILQQGKSERDK
ncbi:MAG: glycosyltransferase family 2 protein [Desulfobacterales bacterium]|jgi:glycosyltransferase involved in cell wall biosynthesis